MENESSIQALHRPIDEQIVQQLLSVIPDGWWSITLNVHRDDTTADEGGMSLSISSDEGHGGTVMPPDEMYQSVIEHAELFERLGRPWTKLSYRVFFDDEIESWRFTIDYSY